ncbi:MAG: copper resistance protein CopC [Chloroflexi bacterium]|nr:copper resistance protein CopC [Chloroflexota bacterium]
MATPTPPEMAPTATPEPVTFDIQEIKTPHYVEASVAHGVILETSPTELSITFNFTLAPPTQLRVVKEGEPIVTSNAISEDRLVLSANVPNQGSGIYIVYYEACWPDGSCHQGQFGFVVA